MRLELRFETRYAYAPPARAAVTALRIAPGNLPGQRVLRSRVSASPGAVVLAHRDAWGTLVHLVEHRGEHSEAVFALEAALETQPAEYREPLAPWAAHACLAPSPRVDPALAPAIGWGSPLDRWSAIEDLLAWFPRRFEYVVGVTAAHTPLGEFIQLGAGVCQDFAHALIAILRAAGRPARYVSGYCFAAPSDAPAIEAAAMHAWVEVYDPALGWVGLDPTTGLPADDRYVIVGRGRDYQDVAPIRGVVTGPASQAQQARLEIRQQTGQQ